MVKPTEQQGRRRTARPPPPQQERVSIASLTLNDLLRNPPSACSSQPQEPVASHRRPMTRQELIDILDEAMRIIEEES